MGSTELLTPVLDDGIRNTNFFNGRLLSAEDLRTEQDAHRARQRHLGLGLGEGIIHGLMVQAVDGTTEPVLSVAAGLAVNREGHTLQLPTTTQVRLTSEEDGDDEDEDDHSDLFADCDIATTTTVLNGTGVYLLVMTPASGYEGKAPMSGLSATGTYNDGCGSKYLVEGVEFKLVAVPLEEESQADWLDADEEDLLRNRVAHLCMGTAELLENSLSEERGPFAMPTTYGVLDSLRELNSLTDCDVPLALFYVDASGVGWIDNWGVRRRPTHPVDADTVEQSWSMLLNRRRRGEAEACFLQFQAQVADLLSNAGASGAKDIKGIEHFRYLPPVGFLPAGSGEFSETFFDDLNAVSLNDENETAPEYVGAFFLRPLMEIAMLLDPIDVQEIIDFIAWAADPENDYDLSDGPYSMGYWKNGDYIVFIRGIPTHMLKHELETEGDYASDDGLPWDDDDDDRDENGNQGGYTPPSEGVPPAARTTGGMDVEVRIPERDRPRVPAHVRPRLEQRLARVRKARTLFRDAMGGKSTPLELTGRLREVFGRQQAQEQSGSSQSGPRVFAEDVYGQRFPAIWTGKRGMYGSALEALVKTGTTRFTVAGLPPGSYILRVQLEGYRPVSRTRRLRKGQTLREVVTLDRRRQEGRPSRPDATGPAGWLARGAFEKLVPLPPQSGPETMTKPFAPAKEKPPLEVEEWLRSLGDQVTAKYPEAAVDPGDIRILIDPAHTPGEVARDPYAYVEFGEGGARLPLLLTPVHQTLDTAVPLSRAGLAGVDEETRFRLEAAGVTTLDALAASWTGLVATALEVSEDSAARFITEARGRVETLMGSVRQFSGVGAAEEEVLRAMAITDVVDLANADPDHMARVARERKWNDLLSPAFAWRLVEAARHAVPAAAWSLEAPEGGLRQPEIDALRKAGITTRGQLLRRLEEDAAGVDTILNVGIEAVRGLIPGIKTGLQKARRARRGALPVSSIFELRSEAGALQEHGLDTTAALAGADVKVVADALGGDQERARAVVDIARMRLEGYGR